MFLKSIIIFSILLVALEPIFGKDLPATSENSDFRTKCMEIMQPMINELDIKREVINQFQVILENKDSKMDKMRDKFEQIQTQLAVTETLIREKERQMVQKLDICRVHRNNSIVKDELLTIFKKQVKTRDLQVEQLQIEVGNKENSLNNCKSQAADQLKLKDDQVLELQEQLGKMLKERENIRSDANKFQAELADAQAQLSNYRSRFDEFRAPNCYWFGNFSGIHEITARGIDDFEVLCDSRLAGPGWTVIQRRMDGSENFYRNWTDYRNGFGSLQGEFFIGLEKLHRVTAAQSYELYVHMESFDNGTFYARYTDFGVGSEAEAYTLKNLGVYSGNVSDGLYYSRNRKFSTYDADNDKSEDNCAEQKHGAWWYDRCGHSNLNGLYINESSAVKKGVYWLGTHDKNFKSVQMMIRPVS